MPRFISMALAVLLLLSLPTPLAVAESTGFGDLQEQQSTYTGQLQGISAEEQQVLAQLFDMNRQLEKLQGEIQTLEQQIDATAARLAVLEVEEAGLRERYRVALGLFGRRVRFMYEQGPVAYLEVVLAATDFTDFLDRLDFLELAIRQDAGLMSQVRRLRAEVAGQQALVLAERDQLLALRGQMVARQDDLSRGVAAREARLAALKEERAGVEARLASLEQVWQDRARPVLLAFGGAFHTLTLNLTDIRPEELQVGGFPPKATLVLSTGSLNDFIRRSEAFSALRFQLVPGGANLVGDFSGVALEVAGRFEIAGDAVLRYAPHDIRFFGVRIPPQTTHELVSSGRLDVDVAALAAPMKVRLTEIRLEQDRMVVRASLG